MSKKILTSLFFLGATNIAGLAHATSITVQGIVYQSDGSNISSLDANPVDVSLHHAGHCPTGCDTIVGTTISIRNGAFATSITPSSATQDLMATNTSGWSVRIEGIMSNESGAASATYDIPIGFVPFAHSAERVNVTDATGQNLIDAINAASTGTISVTRLPTTIPTSMIGSGALPGSTTVDGGSITGNINGAQVTNGTLAPAALSAALTEAQGGTGQSSYTTGDLLFSSASNTLSRLAAGSDGQVLTVSGGVPTWQNATGSYSDTDARAALSVSGTSPLSYNSGSGEIGMTQASGASDGFLTSADFLTFANKLGTGSSLNASNLGSGTVPSARLGSGTANSSSYLRGDGAWSNLPAPSAAALTGTVPVASGGTGSTDGSITGTGQLNLVAGGTNQDLYLAPSGTGQIVQDGNVSHTGTFLSEGTNFEWRATIGGNGRVRFYSNNSVGSLQLTNSSGSNIFSLYNAGDTRINTEGQILSFYTDASTERMRLTPDGSLGIGTAPDSTAILDLDSTDKGVLFPRMTSAQRAAIASPAEGLMVYDTDESALYVYKSSSWESLKGASHEFRASQVSGSATFANNSFTDVVYTSEDYDASSAYDNSTGEFIAPEDGVYSFSWNTYHINSGKVNSRVSRILIDGTPLARSSQVGGSTYNGGATSGSAVLFLSAGQVTKIQAYQQSSDSSTEPASQNTSEESWNFSGAKIGGGGGSGGSLGTNSVQTTHVQNNAITGVKIADNTIGVGKLDFASSEGINIPLQTSDPSSATEGQTYFNSATNLLMYYDGASWVAVGTGSGAVASVNSQTGTVVLDTDDISEGSTNKYYTAAQARTDVIAGITNGTTDRAPSSDAVFDALALKADSSTVSTNATNISGKLGASLPAAEIFVGNGGGSATAQSIGGDATLAIDGTLSLADDSVQLDDIDATGTANATTFLRGDGQWASAGSLSWTEVTSNTTLSANSGVIANNASRITLTLPATCAVGDIVEITGQGAGGWALDPNTGDNIVDSYGSDYGASILSIAQNDAIRLVCTIANTEWQVLQSSNSDLLSACQAGSTTFSYTGSDQSFNVPAGCTSVTVKAWGAGGGGAYNSRDGGAGGFTHGVIDVTTGESLSVVVGRGGIRNATGSSSAEAGGYGFAGGAYPSTAVCAVGHGGGLSGVFRSSVDQSGALVVAGGGGGSSGWTTGGNGNDTVSGGESGLTAASGNSTWEGGAGGGYEGGSLHTRSTSNGTFQAGNGGSGFVTSTGGTTVAISATPEFSREPPGTSDSDYPGSGTTGNTAVGYGGRFDNSYTQYCDDAGHGAVVISWGPNSGAGSGGTASLTADSVENVHIQDSSITGAKIADNTIGVEKLDFASSEGINLPLQTSDPSGATEGQTYFNSSTNRLMYYDGSAWVAVGTGAVASVNSQTGAIVLDTDDIAEGSTNKYYTAAQARTDVIAGITNGTTDRAPSSDAVFDALALKADSATVSTNTTNISGKLGASLPAAEIFVGNGGGSATAQSIGGDATLAIDGTLSLADDSVQLDDIDATGTASSTTFLRGDGQWAETVAPVIRGSYAGLAIDNNATTPDSELDISVQEIVLKNSSNNAILVSTLTETLDAATTGLNALDTGSLAADTWYYVYVISNGSTHGTLLSVSATSPTLPSGYDYWARVGVTKTDSTSDFYGFSQRGNSFMWARDESVLDETFGAVATTATAVDLSTWVPSVATEVKLFGIAATSGTANGFCSVGFDTNVDHDLATGFRSTVVIDTRTRIKLPLRTAQTIYYACSSSTGLAFRIMVDGFMLDAPLGAGSTVQADVAGDLSVGGNLETTGDLTIDGQIYRNSGSHVNSGVAIDWNNGNTQSTSASCGAMTFTNMQDGGSYTLAVKGTTSGVCSFSQSGLTFRFAQTHDGSHPTDDGAHTIFTFLRIGSDVYVSWITGF